MGYLKEGDPARYHLATASDGLHVAVHKKAIVEPSDINRRQVDTIARYFGFPHSFILPSSDHEWGFRPVLRQTESPNPNWVLYSCDLPQGTAYHINKKDYATSATLGLLFDLLEEPNKETDSPVQQQQTIDLRPSFDSDSLMIAHLNPPLVQWLRENISESIGDVVSKAMMKSYDRMYRSKDHPPIHRRFTIDWVEPKWLFLGVPPFANLNSNMDSRTGHDEGYDIVANNVDLPHQQLSLLVGLAKIEELATGAYFRNPQE